MGCPTISTQAKKEKKMIELTPIWRIDNLSDKDNVNLEKLSVWEDKDSGKEKSKWKRVGHYVSVESALNSFVRRYTGRAKSFDNLIIRLNKVEALIHNAFLKTSKVPKKPKKKPTRRQNKKK